MSFFTTTDGGTLVRRVTIQHNGKVGFGTYNPETLLTMVSAAPYLTLYNNTEEDTDGGGESRIIGKREDGAGTPTAAGQIEISHDGSGANDQLGKIILSVNTGAGLVQALKIGSDLLATFAGDVKVQGESYPSPKTKITSIGGYAVLLTNETGAVSVAGELVKASTGTADAVASAAGGELMAIGAFLDDSVAEHAEAWIVQSGIADVKADGTGWGLGDRIVTSGTAKRGAANNNPAVAVHFQEIGHAIETAGANENARCVIHFL